MLNRHRHGLTGVIGTVLIAALVAARFSTLQPIDDPSLTTLIKSDLQQELARLALQHGHELVQAEDGERLRNLESSVVEINAIKASTPALAFGAGSKKVVVRVDYVIRDGDGHRKQQQRYLEAHQRSADEWWLAANDSSAVSYYFNLF